MAAKPTAIGPDDSLELGFRSRFNDLIETLPDVTQAELTATGALQFYDYDHNLLGSLDLGQIFKLRAEDPIPGPATGDNGFESATDSREGVVRLLPEDGNTNDDAFTVITLDQLEYALDLIGYSGNVSFGLDAVLRAGPNSTLSASVGQLTTTNPPIVNLASPSARLAGLINGTLGPIDDLSALKTALGLIEQAYVCILPFCVPSPGTPGPTCADFGPFVWQVGVNTNNTPSFPDWQNAANSTVDVQDLPAGVSYVTGDISDSPGQPPNRQDAAPTGVPTTVGSGTLHYRLHKDGAISTKPANWTVIAAPVTPFAVKAPKYNCQTRQITYQYSGGDGSEVTWFVPGVNGNTTNPTHTVDVGIVDDTNTHFIPITGYQGTGADKVSRTYNFDFRAYCAAPVANIVAPAIPTQYAVVGQPFLYAFPFFTLNGSPLIDGSFSIANQPAGFSLNANTWTGIAQVAGGYMLTLDFTYQGHDYTADFALVVTSPQPAFTSYSLHLYEGDVSGNPSPGGGWADFELKVMLANGNGNQAQVGTRQTQSSNGAADDTLFWFDLNTLTGDSSYNRTRKQSTTTFTGAGQYTHLLYYLRLSPTSPAIQLYDRDITNTDTNKADKVVTGTVGSAGGSSPAPAAEGPGDASLSGTDYQGIAFTTTTVPSNLSA